MHRAQSALLHVELEIKHSCNSKNKCSAVAEMSDRLATIDMGGKLGGLCPFWGELVPHVTQYDLGRGLPSYRMAL